MPDTIRCALCGMTFVVRELPALGRKPEETYCAEPSCKRRFWHAGLDNHQVRVGVFPNDYGSDYAA